MMATLEMFYSLLIVFISSSFVTSQQCEMIEHTIAIDETLRTFYLDCTTDVHHEVRIFKAEYRVLRHAGDRPSDNEEENDSCFIRGLTTEVYDKCHKTSDCLFTGDDFDEYDIASADTYPYACDPFEGDRYVLVTWQCRAQLNKNYNAYAIDLKDNRTHEITFAVVDSHDLWRWVLNYCHRHLNADCSIPEETINDLVLITEHNQGCSFVIPANTEAWVFAREIYKFPPADQPDYQINECTQRIQVYNNERIWYLCETNDTFRLPCQETEHTLYVKYESDDVNVRVGFAIYIEVDFEAPKMLSTCGIPVNELPPSPNVSPRRLTTSTTTTTPAPLRTEPATTSAPLKPKTSKSFDFFDDFPTWILILLSALVSVIFLLIVFTIVYFRHCHKKQKSEDDERTLDQSISEGDVSSERSVPEAYLEGDKTNRMMVHGIKASHRSQEEFPFTTDTKLHF